MMKTTWENIKQKVKTQMPHRGFNLWINPISFVDHKGKQVVLGCPNRFSKSWVEENYFRLIQDQFHQAGMPHVDLVFKVDQTPKSPPPTEAPQQLPLPHIPTPQRRRNLWLNSRFTFDRFIVGQSNEFAYSASKTIALGDQFNYHSLLMLGNTGLGKTHLSQAIGHSILKNEPQSRIFYMTAEDFTNDMISSLKQNRIEDFKRRYRASCDVLLLEGIHFLDGKEKVQAELGYTLDALASDNKKIIFTSAMAPKDIPHISKNLRSRFTSGLVTTISGPDYPTRVGILQKKASDYQVPLSMEVIHFLAERLQRDVRQMESALKCLKARVELMGQRIDISAAKEVVSALVAGESCLSTRHVKDLVCGYYKVDPHMLASKSRKKVHAYPRNIYAYLCRTHVNATLENIGKQINRTHSTVLYSAELVGHKLKTDRKMKHEIHFLSERLEEMKK
ncbi:MAG: chromosomal replication initiator protein DnaA [Desulfatiglandaceae bacterium]